MENQEKEIKPENAGIMRNPDGTFPKGVSGHPEGKPKGAGISITTEIKRKLQEVPHGQEKTYLQLLIDRILKQAIADGDSKLIDRIWAYIDGMPKQTMGFDDSVEKAQFIVTTKKQDEPTNPGDNGIPAQP